VSGTDVPAVQRYVVALESAANPPASFRWIGSHSAMVESPAIGMNEILSIQISYHEGWHATVDGQPREVRHDGLGMLVVQPRCSKPCTVNLSYDGGLERYLTDSVSKGAAFVLICTTVFMLTRRATSIRPLELAGNS
jgi:hypothetical protein